MTDKYEILAMDLLPRIHWLGGPSYPEDDVIRLAEDIARPGWLDRLHAALEDCCPAAVKTFLEAVNAEIEHWQQARDEADIWSRSHKEGNYGTC